MHAPPSVRHFESTVLAHLDAAYNLARWLIEDEAGAQDAVQDACVRALRFFHTLSGPSAKAWFMAIVRNSCMDVLRGRERRSVESEYDENEHGALAVEAFDDPERAYARTSDGRRVREAIASLPLEYRETLVLRELEELSYKEISAIVQVPIGTVMSRLSRGRDLLARRLSPQLKRVTS